MILGDLFESSGPSLEGSYTPDLVFSKLWLARELKQILQQQQGIDSVPVAYILGSWYSNLSTILRRTGVPIEKIVDVEQRGEWLEIGQQLQQSMNIQGVEHMQADANKVDYRQLQQPGIVINTSTNDIADHGWFDHVPEGTIIVLQGRDAVPDGAEHTYNSPEDLLQMYPLETVLYSGTWDLTDPETPYQRSMVIGVKGREQLRELQFLGSTCTKDCSGHRAGYNWSKRKGLVHAASWSPSFNKGAALAVAGK
jgi:hypothetical protein